MGTKPNYDIFTKGLEKEQTAKTKREAAAIVTTLAITAIAGAAANTAIIGLGIAALAGVTISALPLAIIFAIGVICLVGSVFVEHGKSRFNQALDKKDAEMSFEEKREKLASIISNFDPVASSGSKIKNLLRCSKIAQSLLETNAEDDTSSLTQKANNLTHLRNFTMNCLSPATCEMLVHQQAWEEAAENIRLFIDSYGSYNR